MRRWICHPWLNVRIQIALGLVFIVSALPKIIDPPGFAKAIWLYQLAPAWAIHPAALVLPWVELLCGLFLCLGIWLRAATSWIAGLLVVFTVALSINLARHHPVDCGCFTTEASTRTQEERLQDMHWAILRDIGLLLLAAQILVANRRKPRCA
jgi:putative oxidoreductase